VTATVLTFAKSLAFPESQSLGSAGLGRVYDGSWSEWGARADLPVAK